MDRFKYTLICGAFILFQACSAEGPQVSPESVQEDFFESEIRGGEAFQFESISIVPEDQEKASRAPEGMVFIKGGCFTMGNNYAQVDESPEHEACLDDFYMDKYEVTQSRWEKRVKFNPSKFTGSDLPVEQINYYDVQEFISKSEGQCNLPTEAQWEYAARGRAEARYFWGNMMNDKYAWFEDNSGGKTHPVGQKKPNQFGLYDMAGNVWEWTSDWYDAAYQRGKQSNPTGVPAGDFKVIRGGAFDSSAGALRITNRTWIHPRNRMFPKVTTFGQIINEIYNFIGFRCVQPVPPPASVSTSKE
ncbi:MAG: formylglycine-generating enzyme family protein [Nitrospinaceae bacterium]|nr:formylglycine-generating enzyme family protein [Nitrospinaceae bacterium]